MFIAGYALLYSNLTLMVVLGVMLLSMDRYRRESPEPAPAVEAPMLGRGERLAGDHV
jgi:hypothetical protein